MKRLLALWTLCCILGSLPAYGWWQTGHKTIARLAASHLTLAARTRLARILNVPDNPLAVADALAAASVWADETKSETHTGNWHYIDLTLEDSKSSIAKRCPHDNCAPARIRLFAAQLAAKTPNTQWSDLEALRYLIHFVGDIHQPLHTITDDDLGGNCELLPVPVEQANNLHALWDGGMVAEIGRDDRALADSLEKDISTWSSFHRYWAARGNQNDWTWESHLLAIKDIYQRLHIPVEPPERVAGCQDAPAAITGFHPTTDADYIEEMKPVVRMQLEKGGLRLSRLLNETF
jgi:hypothetical protein